MRQADAAGSSRAQASTSASRLGPSSAPNTAPALHSQEPGAPSDPRSAGSPTIPPSPAGSVASGSVCASATVQPRSVPGQSGPPSESSAGPRHAPFIGAVDDEGTEVWPDSDPESFLGDTYRQNLQEVSAFLDQKELEMNLIFAKMRAQLLQAIPASCSGQISGKQAVSTRSDEVTAGWRDLGGPFYRALALQREREKENQSLRETVARKRAELHLLQEKLDQSGISRSGAQLAQPSLAAFSFSNLETSPLAGAVAVTSVTPSSSSGAVPPSGSAGQVGSAAGVQSESFGRQTLIQAEPKVGPQLPLPNTPHFPAATSPRTAPPSPFDLESEGDPDFKGQAGVGAFGSPLDNALKQNVSNLSSKVEGAAVPAQKPSLPRSESATSSVSLSQMYKNSEGQGSAQRR